MSSASANSSRLLAPVGPIVGHAQQIHARQAAIGVREFMPFPQVVLIESDERGCMLYRYRGDRTFCGDTWHASLEEAQAQCSYEYGEALGSWSAVPESVSDAHQFAIASVL